MAKYDPGNLKWRRSSTCDDSSCVEVALTGNLVLIRDSDDPAGKVLMFSYPDWEAFLRSLRDDQQVDPVTRCWHRLMADCGE